MATSATIRSQPSARVSMIEALFGIFRRRPARKGNRLDVRGLSDHLKRDLGFLDGKDPAGTIK